MVVVTINKPNGEEITYYMDGWLQRSLDHAKRHIKKDDDLVILVDGSEGSGKSVLAMQMAAYFDPTFNINRVCISAEQFKTNLETAKKYQAIVFDEAYRGLGTQDSINNDTRAIFTKMMEMRQNNLFVIIVLPTFFMLRTYAAVFRSKALIHVYRKAGRRGYFMFFGESKKAELYQKGKRFFIYDGKKFPRSDRRGRFLDKYVIDEQEYRNKKKEVFSSDPEESLGRREAKYKEQRNLMINAIYKTNNFTIKQLNEWMEEHAFKLSKSELDRVIATFK